MEGRKEDTGRGEGAERTKAPQLVEEDGRSVPGATFVCKKCYIDIGQKWIGDCDMTPDWVALELV